MPSTKPCFVTVQTDRCARARQAGLQCDATHSGRKQAVISRASIFKQLQATFKGSFTRNQLISIDRFNDITRHHTGQGINALNQLGVWCAPIDGGAHGTTNVLFIQKKTYFAVLLSKSQINFYRTARTCRFKAVGTNGAGVGVEHRRKCWSCAHNYLTLTNGAV